MALGNMNYAEVRQCAESLGKSATSMDQSFSKLKSLMESLEVDLKSRAADELYQTYKALEAKIGGFPDKVREFQGFLNEAVEQYESDDQTLANQA